MVESLNRPLPNPQPNVKVDLRYTSHANTSYESYSEMFYDHVSGGYISNSAIVCENWKRTHSQGYLESPYHNPSLGYDPPCPEHPWGRHKCPRIAQITERIERQLTEGELHVLSVDRQIRNAIKDSKMNQRHRGEDRIHRAEQLFGLGTAGFNAAERESYPKEPDLTESAETLSSNYPSSSGQEDDLANPDMMSGESDSNGEPIVYKSKKGKEKESDIRQVESVEEEWPQVPIDALLRNPAPKGRIRRWHSLGT